MSMISMIIRLFCTMAEPVCFMRFIRFKSCVCGETVKRWS